MTLSKPGDRVGAFHEMQGAGGSYAEYALAPDYTTFHIPDETTFEGSVPNLQTAFDLATDRSYRSGDYPPNGDDCRHRPIPPPQVAAAMDSSNGSHAVPDIRR